MEIEAGLRTTLSVRPQLAAAAGNGTKLKNWRDEIRLRLNAQNFFKLFSFIKAYNYKDWPGIVELQFFRNSHKIKKGKVQVFHMNHSPRYNALAFLNPCFLIFQCRKGY